MRGLTPILPPLIATEQYEIQVWWVEDRTSGTLDARVMTYGDGDGGGAGNTVHLNDQFIIGSFTADGGSQTLTLETPGTGGGGPNFGNAHINAYQIRLVPEPGSAILLGLGGLSLLARRRRT